MIARRRRHLPGPKGTEEEEGGGSFQKERNGLRHEFASFFAFLKPSAANIGSEKQMMRVNPEN